MKALRQIRNNIKSVTTIELIARAYQEIARLRMNRVRQGVLENREFIEHLSKIYAIAEAAKEREISKKIKKKYPKEEALRKGEVVIFLSSNERFYGTLNLEIWRQVSNYLAENKADLIVVGRMGKYLAEASGFGTKMFYFELDDDHPEEKRMQAIVEFAKKYKDIIVFHGRFKTILTQEVAQSTISASFISEDKTKLPLKTYLFEPSPEAILEFFETELMYAFFKQTVLEHQLSKYATRMIAMHQASQNAKKTKQQLQKIFKKMQRQLLNKKQIEQFFGLKLWT